MTDRILITGASGFTGRYLLCHLLERLPYPAQYFGVDLNPLNIPEGVSPLACNLTDTQSVISLIRQVRPTRIFHLSGTFTNDMEADYAGNVASARNLFDAVLGTANLQCRVLVVGSAAEYGYVANEGEKVEESLPLRPVSVYGLTKTFQTALSQFYARTHGLHVVIVRPFNLIGYGISSRLFIGRVCEQIIALNEGHASEITLGDLSGARDYIDIKDAVEAYHIALEQGEAGEVYNVGSGQLSPIRQLVDLIISRCGIAPLSVRAHAGQIRPSDKSPSFCADITKLQRLGWSAKIGMETSVQMLAESMGML